MFLTSSQNEHCKYTAGRKTRLLDLYSQNHELDPYNFNFFPFENFIKNMLHRNAAVPFWLEWPPCRCHKQRLHYPAFEAFFFRVPLMFEVKDRVKIILSWVLTLFPMAYINSRYTTGSGGGILPPVCPYCRTNCKAQLVPIPLVEWNQSLLRWISCFSHNLELLHNCSII